MSTIGQIEKKTQNRVIALFDDGRTSGIDGKWKSRSHRLP